MSEHPTLQEMIESLDDRSFDDLKEARSIGAYVGDPYDAPNDCDTTIIVTRGEMRRLRKLVGALAGAPDGVASIAAERQRQVSAEGWTAERDDTYVNGELRRAAVSYALHRREASWPWAPSWWKPGTAIRNLEKAGALIAAEIDRLLRLSAARDRVAPPYEKNGISVFDRVICIDAPAVQGTVVACSPELVVVRWDDGKTGELVWRIDVAYNAYQLQVVRRVAPPSGVQTVQMVDHGFASHPVGVPCSICADTSPTEGEALTALIAKWRKRAAVRGGGFGASDNRCANELEASLTARASSPPPPVSPECVIVQRLRALSKHFHGDTQQLLEDAATLLNEPLVPPSASGPSKERSVPLRQTHYDCGCRIQGGVGVPGCSECTEPGLRS